MVDLKDRKLMVSVLEELIVSLEQTSLNQDLIDDYDSMVNTLEMDDLGVKEIYWYFWDFILESPMDELVQLKALLARAKEFLQTDKLYEYPEGCLNSNVFSSKNKSNEINLEKWPFS